MAEKDNQPKQLYQMNVLDLYVFARDHSAGKSIPYSLIAVIEKLELKTFILL